MIACNTASTIVLPHLRERYTVPFVGTVPAIKPACAGSVTRRVSVLGTKATVSREYTRKLIQDFANGADVKLVGSARLAALAEAELRGEAVGGRRYRRRAGAMLRRGGRPAHRHHRARLHPLSAAAARLERLSPWPVGFIDPAPAIARRVVDLIGSRPRRRRPCGSHPVHLAPPSPGRTARGAGAFRNCALASSVFGVPAIGAIRKTGDITMATAPPKVRRTLQFRFTLPGANSAHIASMLKAATPFYEVFGAGRTRLLQNVDDPARFVQEIEYELPEMVEFNRQRVASDPGCRPTCRPGAPCSRAASRSTSTRKSIPLRIRGLA